MEGKYPSAIGMCVTRDNQCTQADGRIVDRPNDAIIAELSKVGTPIPSRVLGDANGRYGITFTYWSNRSWNNQTPPVNIFMVGYFLKGIKQDCGLANVMNSAGTGFSTTGYTIYYEDGGHTSCYIYMGGPTP